MEWGKLSLDSPGPLKKDIDAALVILRTHRDEKEIVDVIEIMLDDLEHFIVANESDDRIMFFEQQYTRLEQALYEEPHLSGRKSGHFSIFSQDFLPFLVSSRSHARICMMHYEQMELLMERMAGTRISRR